MSVQAIAAKLGCKENEVDGRVAALLEESTSQRTELKAAKQDLTNTKAALKDAEDKLSAYQQKEQAKVKADAEAAVDAAVSERRIPADDRADWLEAYLQAPERTAKQLAGITPAPKLSGVPETGSDKNDPEKDELSPFNKRLAQLEAKNEK
jgi:acyl-CoA reductase-like NAD-dependent aldehyde dehydrogenase